MRVIQSKLRKTNPQKISNEGAQSWCTGPGSAFYVAGKGGGIKEWDIGAEDSNDLADHFGFLNVSYKSEFLILFSSLTYKQNIV